MLLLFDIDDTLFPSTYFSQLSRHNAINAMIDAGLNFPYEHLKEKLDTIVQEKGSNYPYHFDELCKQLSCKNPSKVIAYAVAAYHNTKQSIRTFPSVKRVLLNLKKTHSIYVATEGRAIKQWDKLLRLGVSDFFDDVFISEDLGTPKSEEFYRRILQRLNTVPDNVVMIGDNPTKDIAPAKAVGIKTIRIKQGKYSTIPSNADDEISSFDELLSLF